MASKKKKTPQKNTGLNDKPRILTIADNRRARFDYDILDHLEAGIALTGTEIKAIRAGRVNIRDSFANIRNGEICLHNLHIAQWQSSGPWGHEPTRSRKLLLHSDQIRKFGQSAGEKGLTIIPIRLYIKGHHAKVEIALAKGRHRYDKRRVIMQRETDREIARSIRHRTY